MLSQTKTPLLDTLWEYVNKPHAPFYTPGHKLGKGISSKLKEYFGQAVFKADLPELTDLDNLFAPGGVIQEAQQLAAEAFGASHTWFLVNGSTCGIEAAILATCDRDDKIILPRNVHSSVISGLILSGAIPIFIEPEYDPVLDIAHGVTPHSVEVALKQHPDTKAVMVVYPTYYGTCGDITAIANLVHKYNIPLLVDEAHGAHFAFHPELPISALATGADLSVQSIHKTLGAMTQASMLHVRGNKIDIERISRSLQLVQSTSPNYLLMASLDAARQQMAVDGKELMSQTLQLARTARSRISEIPGLSVLEKPYSSAKNFESGRKKLGKYSPGFVALDETRLTVNVSGLGLTGFAADEILEEKLGVYSELASWRNVTFIISLGNTQEDIDRLVEGFATLAKMIPSSLIPISSKDAKFDIPPTPLNKGDKQTATKPYSFSMKQDEKENRVLKISPREAFFAPTQTLPFEEALGHVSAETICPYPPGIPVLIPGEVVTNTAVSYLLKIQYMGGFISGCTDSSLKTFKIVKL
ncbi:MAG: aminotransferase class I/II-fold pyridoxal phosphate-dependent enzyme [Mastigocoleus sp. MO_167.B18]|nr:aminotransferase class I/II-fold pyridoxal phosphate-dependent enzyme [Mastigocoleus sp. MO_167.B18]